jgi:hypothetical protein
VLLGTKWKNDNRKVGFRGAIASKPQINFVLLLRSPHKKHANSTNNISVLMHSPHEIQPRTAKMIVYLCIRPTKSNQKRQTKSFFNTVAPRNSTKSHKNIRCLMQLPHEIQPYDCRFSTSRLGTHQIIKLEFFKRF